MARFTLKTRLRIVACALLSACGGGGWRRLRRDAFAMPPIASSVPDAEGVQLLRAWINSLTIASCQ